MTEPQEPTPGKPAEAPEKAPEPEWKRKARLAAVFGDVLPDATRDDIDDQDGATSEEWLKRQVPPHHG